MSHFQYRKSARLSVWTVLLCIVFMTLQACSKAKEAESKQEGMAVAISGYNYTIEGIQEFFVNGEWGGGISIGAGGSGRICCIMLPEKWTPGLSATVEWRRSDCGGNGPGNARCPFGTHGEGWHAKTLKATVPVEPYERPSELQVVFLPNDEVKIYSFLAGLQHPSHPAKLGDPRPLDHPEWKPYHE